MHRARQPDGGRPVVCVCLKVRAPCADSGGGIEVKQKVQWQVQPSTSWWPPVRERAVRSAQRGGRVRELFGSSERGAGWGFEALRSYQVLPARQPPRTRRLHIRPTPQPSLLLIVSSLPADLCCRICTGSDASILCRVCTLWLRA